MSVDLVPLSVQILRGGPGHPNGPKGLNYPDFDSALAPALRGNRPWVMFIERYGGYLYDRANDTDRDTYRAVALVPKATAEAAIAAFPGRCSAMTEAELQVYHDTSANVRTPAYKYDADQVEAIKVKYGLASIPLDRSAMDAADQAALDPANPAPGVRKNPEKLWVDRKAALGAKIVAVSVMLEP